MTAEYPRRYVITSARPIGTIVGLFCSRRVTPVFLLIHSSSIVSSLVSVALLTYLEAVHRQEASCQLLQWPKPSFVVTGSDDTLVEPIYGEGPHNSTGGSPTSMPFIALYTDHITLQAMAATTWATARPVPTTPQVVLCPGCCVYRPSGLLCFQPSISSC